jgi:hypothetical protein
MAPGGDTGVDRGTFGFLNNAVCIHFDMFFLSQSRSTKTDGDGYVDGVLQETMSGGTVAYRFRVFLFNRHLLMSLLLAP